MISIWIVNTLAKTFSRMKLSYLFTNLYLSQVRLVLIQLLLMLRPLWNNVQKKFRQCCVVSTFNVGHRRCIYVAQRWKSDVGFCFIFKVRSTFFQRWSTTMKQRWFDVEMLTGWGLRKPRKDKYQNYSHIGPAYISLSQSQLIEWFKLSFSKPIKKKWDQRLLDVINQLSHKLHLLW